MADKQQRLELTDARGGRNGRDWEFKLKPNQVAEAYNVDFSDTAFGRKRGGTIIPTLTNQLLTSFISTLHRHVPGTDETVAELWATDDGGVIQRLAGGTAWTSPTFKDAPTGLGWDFSGASLNGKFFFAFKSAQARLHCWDPNATAGASVRRVGLAVMTAPTVADTGGGAYPAVLRYYRTRAVTQSGGVTIQRSEATSSVSFTPSGGGTAARVTRGTLPSENETHWEVEASTDNAFFFLIATVLAATTTYDDNGTPSAYLNNPASPVVNTYLLPISAKFLAADQSRLLMWGDYTTTNPQNRLYYTPVLGASDVSDDERVPLANYLTLDEKDTGFPTAICGPVNGSFLVFKFRQTWKVTATGNPTDPFSKIPLSKTVGALGPTACDIGEDEAGNPAIYFMSHRGPYRYAQGGLQYLGRNVEDRILPSGSVSQINLKANRVVAWVRWYGLRRQVLTGFSIGSVDNPDAFLIYNLGDAQTPSGWSFYSGQASPSSGWGGRCCVMFSDVIGATMSLTLKPYIGSTVAGNFLKMADSGTTDAGTAGQVAYQAYVKTRAVNPFWPQNSVTVQDVALAAKAGSATVSVSVVNGSGVETRTDSVSLAAVGSETRVLRRVGGDAQTAAASWVQFTVGDAAAVDNSWSIDGLLVSTLPADPLVS